ncbi:uncharacterized protein F5147DRAFT_778699 [Suillus discolor]|uniref:Uncharacterized protein n=1 Tax=Suillus discolor TaxID=1912936 RepID=A0A9P7JPC1_9AGAM|nr:uncharacterized protein F5147DRAFT_778699 [Suillus discolor]KAG2095256.1 hypothetical protein F5147DRAFT_778699 [Suillus discolor]
MLPLGISSGLLPLASDKRQEAETLGFTEIPGCLPIETTQFLIRLVRGHVATVTEAGCHILINILLLRVVSVMCSGTTTVNIIPEFPVPIGRGLPSWGPAIVPSAWGPSGGGRFQGGRFVRLSGGRLWSPLSSLINGLLSSKWRITLVIAY